jgi:hypothetical protein
MRLLKQYGPGLSRWGADAQGFTQWLTPDPYLGKLPGQYLVVNQIEAPHTLVFRQTLPNRSTGSWAFILRPHNGDTRILFRRRSKKPSLFDQIAEPGYFIMDWNMLRGIRRRAEKTVAEQADT